MKPVSLFLAGMKQIASRKFITVVKRFSSFSSDFEFDTTMLILFGLYAIICDVVGYFTGFSVYCCTRARATLLCNRVLSHYIWCHCTTRAGNWSEQKVSELNCGDEGMAFGKQKANGSANRGGQKLCVNVIGKILIGQ